METEAELRKQKKIRPCNDDGSRPEFWELNALIFRPDKSVVTDEVRKVISEGLMRLLLENGWDFGSVGGPNPFDEDQQSAEVALMSLHIQKGIPYLDLANELRERAQ